MMKGTDAFPTHPLVSPPVLSWAAPGFAQLGVGSPDAGEGRGRTWKERRRGRMEAPGFINSEGSQRPQVVVWAEPASKWLPGDGANPKMANRLLQVPLSFLNTTDSLYLFICLASLNPTFLKDPQDSAE